VNLKFSIRELGWPWQLALAAGLAAAILAAGELAPAPFPISAARLQLQALRAQKVQDVRQLASLRSFQLRHAELASSIASSRTQLVRLRQALPRKQQLARFLLGLQQAATASGVTIRLVSAQPVVARDDHYEMPFALTLDGPYFGVESFFQRLAQLPRIVNVGDLEIKGLRRPAKYPTAPDATVTADLTVVTYFQGHPPPAVRKPGARQPPGRPVAPR
jgi:Tfp pilus assembly protein PilO